MPRPLHKLTDRECRAKRTKRGRLADGGGLYLSYRPGDAKSWVFVDTRGGAWRERGLGAYPDVSLAEARELAADIRKALNNGEDPFGQGEGAPAPTTDHAAPHTFGDAADAFLHSMKGSWKNPKHAAQWAMTLGDSYCASLRTRSIADVSTADVLKVLEPIWRNKTETASRLRGRIERVLDYAKVKGWRDGENPAAWRGHLRNVLPAPAKLTARGHHLAMPYPKVPAFMVQLRDTPGLAARALELTILTAARSGETLGATWAEFDLDAKLWIVPSDRMKARRGHRVPLPDAAVDLLWRIRREWPSDKWAFPGHSRDGGKSLSNMAMAAVLKRMKIEGVTVHGFRSSFRDWAAEETDFPREIAEAALAHVVGDATERAYRRGDALEKRRKLMEAWERFLSEAVGGE